MKKKILLLGSLLILAVGGWFVMKYYRTQSIGLTAQAVYVEAAAVKEMTLPIEIRTIGSLSARSVEVTPAIAGHVEKIFFKDGSFVKQGTPLLQLDDEIYKAKHQSAQAQLIYSENDYKRKTLLGKQGAISRQAIDQAEADLKAKQADEKESAVLISKMTLTAPFDGVVGKSRVNPGDFVTVAQSVVTITDTKHLRIEYNVPEQYLPFLKLGQSVKITSIAYPDKTFWGTVSYIAPTISIENRSVSLYAEVPNEAGLLAPGMFVNATQALGNQEHVLMIPARSLVPILEGEQVYKVVDGKAYAVTVLIGKRTEQAVQVTQGLTVGDMVITDGQLKVKNGMPVKVHS